MFGLKTCDFLARNARSSKVTANRTREGGGCVNVCVHPRTHTRVEDSSLSVKQKYTRRNLKVYNFRYYHSSVSNDEPIPAGPRGV